jgi:hypothetical protein
VARGADCLCSCSRPRARPGECPRLCALVVIVAAGDAFGSHCSCRARGHCGAVLWGSRCLRLADGVAAGDALGSHCSCRARCDECQRLCVLMLSWLAMHSAPTVPVAGAHCGVMWGSLMMMLSWLVMQPVPTVPATATATATATAPAAATVVSAHVRCGVVWGGVFIVGSS